MNLSLAMTLKGQLASAGSVPDAPTNLVAVQNGSGQIDLTWDAVAGVDGYYIERSDGDNSSFVQLGSSVSNAYSDTGLASNIYYYRVRAFNVAGNSAYSNEANSPLYILDVEFSTADPAPVTSPYVGEVGQITVTDTVNSYSVASSEIVGAAQSNAARDPWLRVVGGVARAAGLAFGARLRTFNAAATVPQHSLGWVSTLTTPTATNYDGYEIYDGVIIARMQGGGGPTLIGTGFADTVNYKALVALRATGAYFVVDGNLVYVSDKNSTATMYPSWQAATGSRQPFAFDWWRVAQLGGEWSTDTIYTNSIASPTDGQMTTSEQDAHVKFTWTPVAAEVLTVLVRRTDDDNCIKLVCDQAAGTIKLYRREAGVDTEVNAGKTQTWAAGTSYVVYLYFVGQAIRTNVNDVDKHTGNINFNTTATGVKVSGFTTGANLRTYPYVLSGSTLSALNTFFN